MTGLICLLPCAAHAFAMCQPYSARPVSSVRRRTKPRGITMCNRHHMAIGSFAAGNAEKPGVLRDPRGMVCGARPAGAGTAALLVLCSGQGRAIACCLILPRQTDGEFAPLSEAGARHPYVAAVQRVTNRLVAAQAGVVMSEATRSPHRRAAADRSSCALSPCPFVPQFVRCRWRTNSANRAVTGMALATATSAVESCFDTFLYAAVREDPDGTPLTVLSVLARQDVDPWEEAARLAQLPRAAAARALAGLISALPECSATPTDSGTLSTRLISLLPRPLKHGIAQGVPSGRPRVVRIPNRAIAVARAILYVIVIALLLVSQWVVANHQAYVPAKKPPATPAIVVPARATRTTSSQSI